MKLIKNWHVTGSINIFFQRTFTTMFSIANITFIIFSKRVITLSNVSYPGERVPIITGCIPTGDSINYDFKRFENAGLRHIPTILQICTTNQKNQNEGTVQLLTNPTTITNGQIKVQHSMAVMKIAWPGGMPPNNHLIPSQVISEYLQKACEVTFRQQIFS